MERIDDILRGELLGRTFDCECGRRHHVPTRVVDAAPGAVDRAPAVLSEVVAARSALVIADRRTWQAAGERVHAALAPVIAADRALLADGADGQLHASIEAVARLEAATADAYEVYVAVGSGTVNDITKELAHRRRRPYVVVATAASMNGYTSSIVALLDGGLKTTGPAMPPLAVIADPAVLAAAPLELTLAGLGDLVSKPYCGCDWRIASLITGEAVGAPLWAADLGVTRGELAAAIRHGRAIRDRYTVLDVAAELGLLEAFAAGYPDRELSRAEP